MPWPIIGNQRAVQALASAIGGDGVQHAYLFAGPEHLGRATLARLLAQAVNCTGGEPPCGDCGQCRRIAGGIHSDIQTVTVEPDQDGVPRTSISIDQLREVQRTIALNPYEGRSRVVIIDPAHLMLPPAQNAFLKTLEEPPPRVVFVLVTANEDALLGTVRSRCARVELNLVPTADIESALTARGCEPETARLLARLSGGRPGWALAAAEDPKVLERRLETLEAARSLPAMPLADRIDLAEKMQQAFRGERGPVFRTLDGWQAWWRDVLLVQSGAGDAVSNIDMLDSLQADAAATSPEHLLRFLQSLRDTREHLSLNVQSRIALDALMLDVPRPKVTR